MKHLGSEHQELAVNLLEQLNIRVPPALMLTMMRHVDWLIETNAVLNLTAVTEPHAAIRLHLVDSLVAMREVRDCPHGLLVDLGTGGGFPGVELALACDRDALLVDSVRKKCVALDGFLAQESLGSRISVSNSRAEELAPEFVQQAAVVTVRAVSELPALVELAAPLLKQGGRLVALKARPDDSEVSRGRAAAEICGLQESSVRQVVLPGGTDVRTVITFERVRASRVALPRRVGLAQKQPLA